MVARGAGLMRHGWALLLGCHVVAQDYITLQFECGDTCDSANNGVCEDGLSGSVATPGNPPNAPHCPPYSDMTDCGTRCDLYYNPPPPPGQCEIQLYASASVAGRDAIPGNSFSSLYEPLQATGPPSQYSCATTATGTANHYSWTPTCLFSKGIDFLTN